MATEAIKIEGLKEFSKALKQIDNDLPKTLRLAMNQAANIVVDDAKPKVPTLTGKAKKSVKAKSTRTAVRVFGGGNRAPYYPWLEFGGGVGRNKSVVRPYRHPDGRYIYLSYFKKRDSGEFQEVLEKALVNVAEQAGLEVT